MHRQDSCTPLKATEATAGPSPRRPQAIRIQRGLACGVLSLLALAAPARAQPIDQFIAPGGSHTVKQFLVSQAPGFCSLAQCPNPPLGGQPVNETERATSLFLPFTEIQLQHKADSFYFRPGDWKIRLEAANQPFPVDLWEFREEHVELGTGVIGRL